MKIRTIETVRNFEGKRVILRVDMNVPLVRGKILDDFRIQAALPTIKWVLAHRGRLFIIAHLGEPKGRDTRMSIRPIVSRLEKLLGKKIGFVSDPVKENPDSHSTPILFSENLRFWPGEQKNEAKFARSIARWGDVYVNEAFSVSHRNAASIVQLPQLLPAYAGIDFIKEVTHLGKSFKNPKKPFLVIIGGAKVSTKIAYIEALARRSNFIFIGGAMLNTFLAAKGYEIGKSIYDKDSLSIAKKLLRVKGIYLPRDVKTLPSLASRAAPKNKKITQVQKNEYIVEVGGAATEFLVSEIKKSKTILWNGPLGYMELQKTNEGTARAARALRSSRAEIILGGGDLSGVLAREHIRNPGIYISTAGGALLELAANGTLAGIRALERRSH
ncbi:MAG: phosphoglycerate kinase [Candidatus Sungbacteria bacterium]|uniref:Phosphoglycerate kinase n=1 Tax=Candidatus Sungiibacteriota bacterium TaxID=2750080 RepID=A0A9D6LR20_9BACT|nr:phosphoglycerate kinase [Candidatus Sungbacteria bacterium]